LGRVDLKQPASRFYGCCKFDKGSFKYARRSYNLLAAGLSGGYRLKFYGGTHVAGALKSSNPQCLCTLLAVYTARGGKKRTARKHFIIIPRTASPPSSLADVLMDADVRDATTISLISLLALSARCLCAHLSRVEFRPCAAGKFSLLLM